ncbi:RNA polymerase sigma factor [Clostridium sp. DL1XJH146]
MSKSDELLVMEILNGNIKSFEKIVEKYQTVIIRYVNNFVKDQSIAEDISQEVFITIYNKLKQYNNKYKFSNWMFQIAKNKTIDYIRKKKRLNETIIEGAYDLSSNDNLEEIIEFNETKKYINEYINTLDKESKQILSIRYTSNKTFKDISKILNISESTVKRKYYNVRKNFSEFIICKEKGCEYGL